jgi:hypothetical protein
MQPAPSLVRRLAPLGCALALLGTAAPALSACGGNDAPTAAEKPAATPQRQARGSGERCRRQVSGLLKSLAKLRGSLALGLSYEQYVAALSGVRAAYGRVPVQQLTLDCLSSDGTPAEQALNRYIDAANAWGECLSEAGCDTSSIEAGLQKRWRVASHYLSETR